MGHGPHEASPSRPQQEAEPVDQRVYTFGSHRSVQQCGSTSFRQLQASPPGHPCNASDMEFTPVPLPDEGESVHYARRWLITVLSAAGRRME